MVSRANHIPIKTDGYLFAQDIFYTQFNDIKFFIEDTESENLYLIILSKLFPKIKLENIFSLGGKINVIDHANENKNIKNHIYLVDKDFDDLLNKMISLPALFYLERYEIENYFIESEAIIKFIISMKPRIKLEKKSVIKDLDKFINHTNRMLHKLFFLFFISQLQEQKLKNVKLTPEWFAKYSKMDIDEKKIIDYQKKLITQFEIDLVDLKKEI